MDRLRYSALYGLDTERLEHRSHLEEIAHSCASRDGSPLNVCPGDFPNDGSDRTAGLR